MKPTPLLASIAMLAAAIHMPVLAGDRENGPQRERPHTTDMRAADGDLQGMQPVAHSAASDAPGYGWRYFSDPPARVAVVISPQGDYYYSHRGQGLRWIAAQQR